MNSRRLETKLTIACIMLMIAMTGFSQKMNYPPTKKVAKESTYHGTKIKDNYSWLNNADSEEVKAWSKAQDEAMVAYTRSLPQYEALKKKVGSLMRVSGRMMLPSQGGGHYFYTKQEAQGAWGLYKQDGKGTATKLELPFDARAALFFLPSPDAKMLALGMARPGGYFDWKVFDVDNQQLKEATIIGAHMGDTRLSWSKDGSGFYYVGMDVGEDQQSPRTNKQVRYHKVNSAATEDKAIYTPESPGSKLHLDVSDDGKYIVIAERAGAATNGKIKYASTSGPDKAVKELVSNTEASYVFLGNDGPKFYFQTDLGATNGKIASVNINRPTRVWKDLVREGKDPMMGFQSAGGTMVPLMAGNKFVVPTQKDLKISLKVYGLNGKLEKTIAMPAGGLFFRANGLNALSGNRTSDEVLAQFIGIIEPNTVFSANVNQGKVSAFSRAQAQFNAEDYVTEIAFTESKDGTRIPISVTYKKGMKRNGKNYMMMQVYGAIAFTNYPYFQGDYMAWLDMGGIHAVAHIRGGGAYGSQWHKNGITRKKQNGVDDYIATLEWAIKKKYTTANRMVINGVSAGTIPVAAVMTQRPDLVGAVVSHYGMLDMIGYAEKLGADPTHGDFVAEIGTAADAADFKALNAYSPYQKLTRNTKYPPMLALTSEMDAPLNTDSYKYIAQLQNDNNSTGPMLLQMAWGSGHSAFGSQTHSPVITFTDELAFLIKAMKIDVKDWLK